MRLLTHNTMRNNTKDAAGKGFPLRITAVEVKVVDNPEAGQVGDKELEFVKHVLSTLDWPALVQVRGVKYNELSHALHYSWLTTDHTIARDP